MLYKVNKMQEEQHWKKSSDRIIQAGVKYIQFG